MSKKCLVVINESHNLFSEQEKILKENYNKIEYLKVPPIGWKLEELQKIYTEKIQPALWVGYDIIFVSPIPYLIMRSSFEEGQFSTKEGLGSVRIFHNNKREKKELDNGKIIQIVAENGWILI